MHCPNCTQELTTIDLGNVATYICQRCAYNYHPPKQLELTGLSSSFNLPTSGRKTLKTSVKKSEGLECALMKAYDFIQRGNKEGYTAIEFPYGGCYFVIAKLKDKS